MNLIIIYILAGLSLIYLFENGGLNFEKVALIIGLMTFLMFLTEKKSK
jgi:hypothetical protein